MGWQYILAIVIAIPVILLPVALIWYLNVGGVVSALRRTWLRRASSKKVKVSAKAE